MRTASVEDLPILGEPLPVELANTLYVGPEERLDFLGDPATARLWLDASGVLKQGRLAAVGLASVRALRDAVRALLLEHLDGQAPDRAALAEVDAALVQAPSIRRLSCEAGRLVVAARHRGPAAPRVRGALARAFVDFVAAGQLDLVRRCPGPGCPMLFVAAHHRRKFCHPSCSHRARQAAYYRRQRGAR